MTNNYDYDFLSKLDGIRESDKDKYAEEVKLILKEFLYTELDISEIFKKSELKKVRHSIINFFYSGKFTLVSDAPILYSQETYRELVMVKDYENEIELLDNEIYDLKNQSDSDTKIEELKKKIKDLETKCSDRNTKLNHRNTLIEKLQNCGEKERNNISKDIAKLEKKISDTSSDFFNKIEQSWKIIKLNYEEYLTDLNEKLKPIQIKDKVDKIIVYEAPPYLGNRKPEETYFMTNKSSKYSKVIFDCFAKDDTDESLNVSELLIKNNIGFFDLSMACLPLSDGDIRKNWNTKEEFKIGGKQLPVLLFELSLEHFIDKVGFQNIAKQPLFAIGMPLNTSACIFEHFSKQILKVYKCDKTSKMKFKKNNELDEIIISADLGITNSTTTYIRRNAQGETFPLFKSNVVNSGYPSAILMKNAFNLETD